MRAVIFFETVIKIFDNENFYDPRTGRINVNN